MENRQEFERCAERLKGLADRTRLQIVQVLLKGELPVSSIAAAIELDISMTSHHLGLMHRAKPVNASKQGRFVHYSLRPDVVQLNAGKPLEKIDLRCCAVDFAAGTPFVQLTQSRPV
jgi:DNA-binding transcriptional ArsR family regulator